MAWGQQDVIRQGQYIMAEVVSGVNFDLTSTITDADLGAAIQRAADGWNVVSVTWERGLFGFGETLRIYGQASAALPSQTARLQVESGINSFWMIAGAEVSIYASENMTMPQTKQAAWAESLQLLAIAAIVIGAVWGIKQIKEIAE